MSLTWKRENASYYDGMVERDLADINGDGLLDHVDARPASAQTPYWEVRRNLAAVRPHTLTRKDDGLGGITLID